MPRKKSWRRSLVKMGNQSRASSNDHRLVEPDHVKNWSQLDPTNNVTFDGLLRLVVPGHVKNRSQFDLGDTGSLKRVNSLPSGANNIADLLSGSKKCGSLPSGSTKCATLPSGANNIQNLSSDFKNSSDIVKTSLSYINEEKQVCASKLIFGSFHQGDDTFFLFSRGSQCTCNALKMLVKCFEGFSFTSELIDKTLILGNQLYAKVVKSLQEKGTFLNKFLSFDKLPLNVTLGENHHVIQKFNSIWGLVVSEEQNSQVKRLNQALEESFQISRYLMIMIGSICSAIYKVSNKEYYFFDSHCHDSDGMSSFDGKSLLVFNRNIDDLVSYLYNKYRSIHIDFAMQFEILPISIATVCHSFPEKDPLQKWFYKMDEKQPVTNLVAKEQDRKSYMRDYMKKKRQNEQFKQHEKNKEMLSRKLKRQNVKEREKERECEREGAKKLKRQSVESRGKEKECDRGARKLKRQRTEVKEKENKREIIARKLKRQQVEVREKEKECDRGARKLKRQSVEVKEKENERKTIARKLKRQHVEVREKERECDRGARKLKRQSAEVRGKEKECDIGARKLKQQSAEVKEKENKRETIARKLKGNKLKSERKKKKRKRC